MTAVTLSSLAYRSLVIEPGASAAGGGVGRGEAGRSVALVSDRGATAHGPRATPAPGPVAPPACEPPAKNLDALEHCARGLLNLTALLSRCLDGAGGSAEERRGWRDQVAEANERLEMLYHAGLPRTFLSGRVAKPSDPNAAPAVAADAAREAATPTGGAG